MSGAAPGIGSWTFEPIAIIVAIAATWWYVGAYRRAAERGRALGAGWWTPFAIGVAVLLLSAISPLAALADGWLLTASTVQHVLLTDVAPALMLLGMRSPLFELARPFDAGPAVEGAAAASRRLASAAIRLLERRAAPAVVVPLWIAITWLWSIPAVADFAAQHAGITMITHLTLILSGLALWWLMIDPLPKAEVRPNGQRMALLGVTHVASACVCLPLMWLSHVQYPLFASSPRVLGLSAITDQHAAGGLMSLIEFLVFGLAFAGVFISVLSRADAEEPASPSSAMQPAAASTVPAGTAGTRR